MGEKQWLAERFEENRTHLRSVAYRMLGSPKDATTVRVHDGATITSDGTVGGPDATVGSFYVFEAEDKAAAIEFASRIPAARIGGAIEVRPVGQYW